MKTLVKDLGLFAALLFLMFANIQCGSLVRSKKEPVAAPIQSAKLLKQAERDMAVGSQAAALNKVNQILKSSPGSDVSDDAYLLQGKIHFSRQQYNRAFKSFSQITESEFFSPIEAEALLWMGKSLNRLARYDAALSTSERLIDRSEIDRKLLVDAYQVRLEAQSKLGDHLDALRSLVFLSKNHPDKGDRSVFQSRAMDYVQTQLNEKELKIVADSSEFGIARAFALFGVGKKLFENQDFGRAASYFNDVEDVFPNSELSEKSNYYLKQIAARRKVNPKTIGVVLPLTGKHESVARKTLHGIQLGLGIFGRSPSNFRLAVVDSESNPDSARRAVERLVLEDNVIAIVGGLLSKTSIAISTKAQELGVPNISLSQKEGLTEIGDHVFRNALTSQMQIKHLVTELIQNNGLKRFAILHPNDRYGTAYSNLFWDEVIRQGGEIRGAQAYDPNETDFNGPIQRLVGRFYLEDRLSEYKLRVSEWMKTQKRISDRVSAPDDLLPPIVDFDAIFIPDNIKAVGQIAPMLAYHEINGVRLVGTNLWNSKTLVKRGQQYVEGAFFVDNLSLSQPSFRRGDFYKQFSRIFGAKPGIFEAQGYDAGVLARQIVASGESSRDGFRERLTEIKSFNGSLGLMRMTAERELVRPLTTLTVSKGRITTKTK